MAVKHPLHKYIIVPRQTKQGQQIRCAFLGCSNYTFLLCKECHSRQHRTKQDSLNYTKLIEKWMRFLKHKNRNPKHVVCGSRGSLWPFAPVETNHSSSILGILFFSMYANIAGIWCLHASQLATSFTKKQQLLFTNLLNIKLVSGTMRIWSSQEMPSLHI